MVRKCIWRSVCEKCPSQLFHCSFCEVLSAAKVGCLAISTSGKYKACCGLRHARWFLAWKRSRT